MPRCPTVATKPRRLDPPEIAARASALINRRLLLRLDLLAQAFPGLAQLRRQVLAAAALSAIARGEAAPGAAAVPARGR